MARKNMADPGSPPVSDKRSEILEIASDIFLDRGYSGSSINEMARRSRISKETFYRYFKNKEQLFLAVIDKELEGYWEGLSILDNVPDDQDPQTTLSGVGRELLHFLLSRRTLAVRQLIFSECGNHPDIGKLYFDHGPNRAYKALSSYFEKERKMGLRWRLPPRALAENFMAILFHKATLEQQCRIKSEPDGATCRRQARRVARDFVAAYQVS